MFDNWSDNHSAIAFLFLIIGILGTMTIMFKKPDEKKINEHDSKGPDNPSDN